MAHGMVHIWYSTLEGRNKQELAVMGNSTKATRDEHYFKGWTNMADQWWGAGEGVVEPV